MEGHDMSASSRLSNASTACVLRAILGLEAADGAPAQATPVAVAEDGVDPRVAPGDDFFAFANGEWLAKTQIPAGKSRWGARDEIAARAARQLARVIQDAGKPGSAPQGRKVADFYAAYVDEAGIEKNGFAPIAPLLEGIERLNDKADLSRWLGAHLRADVDPLNTGVYDSPNLFGLAVCFGVRGEPNHFAYFTQGGLGLGDRDSYLDDADAKRALRLRYRDYIAGLLQAAGFDDAPRRADGVLALETAIARVHASAADSSNDRNAENFWGRGDFMLNAPGIDWSAFFRAAGLPRQQDFVAWQPDAIKGSAALVGSQPLPAWKDYLRFHVVHRYADVLPRSVAEPALAFGAMQSRASAQASREQRAVEATSRAMPEAVGRLYVARYFPPGSKSRAQSILDDVVAAFRKRVASAPWMSEGSRRVALAKLNHMYFGVGYPERWIDDSKPAIDVHDPVGNLQRVADWNYRNALAKLGHDVDRREWVVAPQWPGAILNFQLNSYNFSAALLQPPKFDPAASEAASYGAIGAIFAHEVVHFVDALGADYDAQGATRAWWTAQDKARYEEATRPLVEQFSAYRPLPDLAIDGKRTLVENVADLGGLAAAFDAYRDALGSRAADAQALRRQDREFFIGYARSWRNLLREDALRAMVKGDSHAPEAWRIATVRNLDAWYEAFDVKPGQRLYLEPKARVRVW
jgi:putative endopeptidase